ncbi:MAG: hypothetical protein WAM97_08735 [Acidimicrobiales bacterium]
MELLGPDGKELKRESAAYRRTLIGFRRDSDVKAEDKEDDGGSDYPSNLSISGRRHLGGVEEPSSIHV